MVFTSVSPPADAQLHTTQLHIGKPTAPLPSLATICADGGACRTENGTERFPGYWQQV